MWASVPIHLRTVKIHGKYYSVSLVQKEKGKGNIKYLIYKFGVEVGKEGSDITRIFKEETKTAREVAILRVRR